MRPDIDPRIVGLPLTWGAIAYSPSTRRQNYSFHAPEQAWAEADALRKLGMHDGRILISGNATYLGLAISENGFCCPASSGTYGTPEEAEKQALECCKNYSGEDCKVVLLFYTPNGYTYINDPSVPRPPIWGSDWRRIRTQSLQTSLTTPIEGNNTIPPQPVNPPLSPQPPSPYRWGWIFGVIADLAIGLALILDKAWGTVTPTLTPGAVLIQCLIYLGVLLCPLSGLLTAHETGHLKASGISGFIEGAIWGIGYGFITFYEDTIVKTGHIPTDLLILNLFAIAVFGVIGGILGILVGIVGGLIGRKLH